MLKQPLGASVTARGEVHARDEVTADGAVSSNDNGYHDRFAARARVENACAGLQRPLPRAELEERKNSELSSELSSENENNELSSEMKITSSARAEIVSVREFGF